MVIFSPVCLFQVNNNLTWFLRVCISQRRTSILTFKHLLFMFRGTRDNRVFILTNLDARSYKNIKFKFATNIAEVQI